MSMVRVSEESLNKRREEIKRLKDEVRGLEAITAEKESPLWKRIGPSIQKSIEANREKIERILSSGPVRVNELNGMNESVDPMSDFASLKLLGGAITMARNIQQEVEVEAAIERKRDRIAKLTDEIKKISEEQGI